MVTLCDTDTVVRLLIDTIQRVSSILCGADLGPSNIGFDDHPVPSQKRQSDWLACISLLKVHKMRQMA